jgi:hypothetical protein
MGPLAMYRTIASALLVALPVVSGGYILSRAATNV